MIVAISRFAVKNGKEADVRAAFENRPRQVETVPGFLGLEVFQDGPLFVLLTRWSDEPAFRAWHASPAHHDSHALIPKGLKLDASMTQVVVATRIPGATSDGTEGELVRDLSSPLAHLLRDGAGVHVAVVDGDGRVTRANPAFVRLASGTGGTPVGRELAGLITPASQAALSAALAEGGHHAALLQLMPEGGEPASLRCFVYQLGSGFAVVGEPPWADHRALEVRLGLLNDELVILTREAARRARLLAEANDELQRSHWHLKKISEVLPMCVTCRAVKTSEHTWEDVAAFLVRTTDFISHGYCAHCAAQLTAEIEAGR